MWGGGKSHPSVTFSVLIWRESCSHDIVIWAEWKRWGVIYISFIISLTQTETRMMRLLPSHCVSDENVFHVLFLIFCFHRSSHNSQQRSQDTQSVSTKSFYFYFPTFPHKIFLLFVPPWGNLSSTSAAEHQNSVSPYLKLKVRWYHCILMAVIRVRIGRYRWWPDVLVHP